MPFLPHIYSFASEVSKKKDNNNYKWLNLPKAVKTALKKVKEWERKK